MGKLFFVAQQNKRKYCRRWIYFTAHINGSVGFCTGPLPPKTVCYSVYPFYQLYV